MKFNHFYKTKPTHPFATKTRFVFPFLFFVVIFLLGCSKNSGFTESMLSEKLNNESLKEFLSQLSLEEYPQLMHSLNSFNDEELKSNTAMLLTHYWMKKNAQDCFNALESLFNDEYPLISDMTFIAIKTFYTDNTDACWQFISQIDNSKATWRSKCFMTLLELKFEDNPKETLTWIDQNTEYKHYLSRQLLQNFATTDEYPVITSWLSKNNNKEEFLFETVISTIHQYSNYFPNELLAWMDTLEVTGKLKSEAWNTALRRVSEFIPGECIKYINSKDNIIQMLTNTQQVSSDSIYEQYLENLLTGIIYSEQPGAAYLNLGIMSNEDSQFNLRKYFYYIANRYGYKDVWHPKTNLPSIKRHEIGSGIPKKGSFQIDFNDLISISDKDGNIFNPIENNREYRCSFNSTRTQDISLIINRIKPSQVIFTGGFGIQTSSTNNKIDFRLKPGKELVLYLPYGFTLRLQN
ncbi:MAG: hypothetical protein MI922_22785 [Bacteroidales bacterium]|nr:hypothetical protein [Bacteroidales bacterium]